MSENHLDWLTRVSQEDASNTSVSIKPEGVDPKEDEANDHVGGDEKSTAQGSDNAKNHEIDISEEMEPDDNPEAKKADDEIGVKNVSKESGDSPDFRIDLQTGGPAGGKASTEDGDEEPADDDAEATPPADGADADTPAESDMAPAEGADAPAADDTTPVEGADAAPAEGDDAPGTDDLGVDGTDQTGADSADTTAEGGDEGVATLQGATDAPAEGEATIPVPIDPVTEIKEGTDAAIAEAEANPEGADAGVPGVGETETEGDGETVSQEGFGGGLLGFLAGSLGWAPFVGAGVHAAAKTARLKLQQDIEKISKRIADVRKGDIEDAKKNGTKVPKSLENFDFVTVIKSALLGQFFGPFYGAHQGSELENLNDQLQAKLKELKAEMDKAGISTEDFDVLEDEGLQQDTEFDGEADDGIMQPVEDTLEDVQDIGAMQVAVENYTEILNEVQARGQAVDPLLARSIQIGLRSFKGENLADGQPSVEDFKDGANQFTVSQELMDDLKGKGAAIGEAMINAVKKLLQILADTVSEIRNNTPALKQKNDELLKRASGLKGQANGKIPVGSAARLFIGNNFAGDKAGNYADLQKYADKFLVDYPKYWNGVVQKLWQLFEANDSAEKIDLGDIAQLIGNGYQPGMFGLVQSNDVPNGDRYDNNYASPTLLGNRKLVVHVSKAAERNGVSALTDVFSVELASLPTGGGESTEVMLPDGQSLRQILTALDKLIAQVPNYAEAGKKLAQNQSITKVLTHKLLIGAAGEHGASSLAASMTKPTGAMVGHVVNTIKVAHKFVEHCLAQHEGASK